MKQRMMMAWAKVVRDQVRTYSPQQNMVKLKSMMKNNMIKRLVFLYKFDYRSKL